MAKKKGDPNFSIDQKAHAVAILQTEARGNFTQAERFTGVGRDTIRNSIHNPEIVGLAQEKIKALGHKFLSLSDKLVEKYAQIAESATFDDKSATVLGIVTDKALLCLGQPTSIVANLDVNQYLQELASRGFSEDDAKAIVEKAQARLSE